MLACTSNCLGISLPSDLPPPPLPTPRSQFYTWTRLGIGRLPWHECPFAHHLPISSFGAFLGDTAQVARAGWGWVGTLNVRTVRCCTSCFTAYILPKNKQRSPPHEVWVDAEAPVRLTKWSKQHSCVCFGPSYCGDDKSLCD